MYRYISTCLYIFTALVICVESQSIFFKTLETVFQDITSNINSSIAQEGSILVGDVIADLSLPLVAFAVTLGRLLGNGQEVTSINNSQNIVDIDYAAVNEFKAGLSNEDARLNIEELLHKYGHPLEKHQVATEDKYLLTIHRIPGKGPPIFLMHGLSGSAEDWLLAGPESALGYLLANDGFDVWLGNARGNKFSRQHAFLHPSEASFWNFSWHEIGYYDLPAMIDYVLQITGSKSVKYIGHSQGTTSFFVMASEKPEYNSKIDVMFALSPVAFMSNLKSPPIKLLAAGTTALYAISKMVGLYEYLTNTRLTNFLKVFICGRGVFSAAVCASPTLLVFGFSIAHTNFTNLPVVLGHEPSGISIKQVAHYGQEILSGKFRQFDYGAKNLEMYGRQEPPDYNVQNIVASTVFFYSPEDWLASPQDVEKLADRLGSKPRKYLLPDFKHQDYIFGKDSKSIIYSKIFPIINNN